MCSNALTIRGRAKSGPMRPGEMGSGTFTEEDRHHGRVASRDSSQQRQLGNRQRLHLEPQGDAGLWVWGAETPSEAQAARCSTCPSPTGHPGAGQEVRRPILDRRQARRGAHVSAHAALGACRCGPGRRWPSIATRRCGQFRSGGEALVPVVQAADLG